MAGHDNLTNREKFLVERERLRALRLEDTVKKAVKVASDYKKAYESLRDENGTLKKSLANTAKTAKRLEKGIASSNRIDIASVLATLDEETFLEVKTALRKSVHPDKHNDISSKAKNALGNIFYFIEELFK